MKNFIILSEKSWHKDLFQKLKVIFPQDSWTLIKDKNHLSVQNIESINPDKIFIPHWSYIIPEEIFNNFECIVFHMTDLPFGRGGSPLQNLIIRGFKQTKISAIRVEEGLDAGPVYLKKTLSLSGSAEEIFIKASRVIEKMIVEIIKSKPIPTPQNGDVVVFKRRKPEDGNLSKLKSIEDIYDYIRMLDAEGYPNAFLEFENFKLEFSKVKVESHKSLIANVRIVKK